MPTHTGIPCLSYRGSGMEYRVYLDTQDGAVLTQVRLEGNDPPMRADLRQIVIAAGLGPAQAVRTSARSIHAMKQSLESQVMWISRVHNLVSGDEGARLLERASLISI